MIDKEDIYKPGEYGLENDPHVTLLFGLPDEISKEDIETKLQGFDFSNCTIRNASLFKQKDFEVLKFEAYSNDFQSAHKKLDEIPNEDQWSKYDPHMTIAYLKPGRGDEYVQLLKGYSDYIESKGVYYSLINGKNLLLNV